MQKIILQSRVILVALFLLFTSMTISANDLSSDDQIITALLADYTMTVENTSALAGDHGHVVRINGTWLLGIRTYAIKLAYDTSVIEISSVTLTGCVGENPSSFTWKVNKTAGFITAVVTKTGGIPAGGGKLLNIIMNISDTAPPGKTTLDIIDGLETYYRDTNNILRTPVTFDGTVDISVQNVPPQQPTILAPSVGGPEVTLNISAVSVDYDGDQIYYNFSWGDGNFSGWLGPSDSDVILTTNYTWWQNGDYQILVKAKDTNEMESDWSSPHNISIARQIELKNIHPGFIYIYLFSFNKSYFYIHILEMMGATVFLTTNDLSLEAQATDAVKKVTFEAVNPMWGDLWVREDDNGTDGYSCEMNLTLGLYQLTVAAYDSNGYLIDYQIFSFCLYLRLGAGGSNGPSGLLRNHLNIRR